MIYGIWLIFLVTFWLSHKVLLVKFWSRPVQIRSRSNGPKQYTCMYYLKAEDRGSSFLVNICTTQLGGLEAIGWPGTGLDPISDNIILIRIQFILLFLYWSHMVVTIKIRFIFKESKQVHFLWQYKMWCDNRWQP